MGYQTEQESFWSGEFGTDYIDRNRDTALLASNLKFFSRALSAAEKPVSCIEFGANIGMNLRALGLLYPGQDQHGVEINSDAARLLGETIGEENVTLGSMLNFSSHKCWELALVKGVLIHLNPDFLPAAYDLIAKATSRYVLLAEYYNPSPVSISYRGHENRLFKRDFAGEFLDAHSEFRLLDYGFAYRRDPSFPQDDITWFLMEKFRV